MVNKELDLAWQFVNLTDRNVFLTGKAGTGKTTFLHRLRAEGLKRSVVAAPTGVAAINAKGVTLHSLFQLPFGITLPGYQTGKEKLKFRRSKIELIRSMDLLIIDEISMVRADVLDAVDAVLRRFRDPDKVFGGVQVLMIGDLQQLPPVTKSDEWEILKKFYETPYFFSSNAYKQSGALTIELKHIYRQEDEEFIRLLNEIREGKLSRRGLELLNSRYMPDFEPGDDEGYILLTTHNYKADRINRKKLEALPGATVFFEAEITGHFPENAYPAKELLALKPGAQVMFIKNDRSGKKRYFNGKIGRVVDIEEDTVWVKSPGDEEVIEVKKEIWENIRYEVDPHTREIREERQGTFEQIPLRLAWAITIHKSQGLTFDKAIIDAEFSFAHGQTYVALSRCRSLEGLVLKSPLTPASIIRDGTVNRFSDQAAASQPGEETLKAARREFFLRAAEELFDFTPLQPPLNKILQIYRTHRSSIEGNLEEILPAIQTAGIVPLNEVKEKFLRQLRQLTEKTEIPWDDPYIRERMNKALAYFSGSFQEKILQPYYRSAYVTENKQLQEDLEKQFDELEKQLRRKEFIYEHLKNDFRLETYLRARAMASGEKKAKRKKKEKLPETSHPGLCELLRHYRREKAEEEQVPAFHIFTQRSLYALCEDLPVTTRQLKKVHGFGKVRIAKYGEDILEIIRSYSIANEIPFRQDKKPAPKIDTRQVSLELFRQGLSPDKIARERNLKPETIFRHLASFVPSGEITITELVPEEKYRHILDILRRQDFESLRELKEAAGEEYGWEELRLVRDLFREGKIPPENMD